MFTKQEILYYPLLRLKIFSGDGWSMFPDVYCRLKTGNRVCKRKIPNWEKGLHKTPEETCFA